MPVSHLMFHSSFGPAIHIAGPQYFVLVIFIIITSLRCVDWETAPCYLQLLMTSQKTFPFRIDHVGYLISVNPLSRTSVNPINICGDKAMFQRPAYFQGTVFRDKITEN